MITPIFSIIQNDDWLTFSIRAPYAKIATTEIEYGEEIFMFSAKPYFLRIHLPCEVIDDNTGTATYNSDKGEFTVRVPKKIKGEHFPRLDMITELLRPQRKITGKSIIEEIDTNEVEDDNSGDEYMTEQSICDVAAGIQNNITTSTSYGFGWKRTGILEQLHKEIGKLIDLVDPKQCLLEERVAACAEYDAKEFDPERYLADTLDPDEEVQRLISLDFGTNLTINDLDREKLKNLPNKKLPKLSPIEHHAVAFSIIDLVFAFAYDQRVNEWESSSESGWTISKLSASLSFLCKWNSPQEALIASVRRALCYPLYRNWDLAQKIVEDTKYIINQGRSALLHVFCSLHSLLQSSGEFRYLLNDIYITDYCLWIQTVDDFILESLVNTIETIKVDKCDVGLDLDELEIEARLIMLDIGNKKDLDSDDESEPQL